MLKLTEFRENRDATPHALKMAQTDNFFEKKNPGIDGWQHDVLIPMIYRYICIYIYILFKIQHMYIHIYIYINIYMYKKNEINGGKQSPWANPWLFTLAAGIKTEIGYTHFFQHVHNPSLDFSHVLRHGYIHLYTIYIYIYMYTVYTCSHEQFI